MNFIRIKNKNQYQREQSIQFFNKLQTLKPFLEQCYQKLHKNKTIKNLTLS